MKDVMCLLDSCLSSFEVRLQGARYLDFYFLEFKAALRKRDDTLDVAAIEAVETEWRQLYPVAWADYYRFLDGWAPGKYPLEGHTEDMMSLALKHLTRGLTT